MQELELKLLIDTATAKVIWKRASDASLASAKPRPRRVTSTYVDTPNFDLRQKGISLRLRQDGKRWLQTVKARASLNGGMSNVTEIETVAPDGRLNLAAIPDRTLRHEIVEAVNGAALKPVCQTLVRRTEGDVTSKTGTRALLAVDLAEVKAGGKSGKFCELELEHLEGPLGGLFDIARALLPDGGVRFSSKSKAERGFLLAEAGTVELEPLPRTARTVAVTRSQTVGQAAQEIFRECAAQIVDNIDVVLAAPLPEGPHQLRIGLRRLRSGLQVFDTALEAEGAKHLGQEARWLGQEVGKLRDLDVILHDLVLPTASASSLSTGFDALAVVLEQESRRARDELRSCLRSRRVQDFLFDLMRFIETRDWLQADAEHQPDRRTATLKKFAPTALDKRWKKVRRRARKVQRLSIDERHELRKELKRMRYAAEFLAPIYPADKRKPFLKRLKKLQQVFGDLNDVAMVDDTLLHGTIAKSQPGHVQQAIGWLLGASSTKADMRWEHAQELWSSLKNTSVFWK